MKLKLQIGLGPIAVFYPQWIRSYLFLQPRYFFLFILLTLKFPILTESSTEHFFPVNWRFCEKVVASKCNFRLVLARLLARLMALGTWRPLTHWMEIDEAWGLLHLCVGCWHMNHVIYLKLRHKPNTSAHPNRTSWIFKQFFRRLFSW